MSGKLLLRAGKNRPPPALPPPSSALCADVDRTQAPFNLEEATFFDGGTTVVVPEATRHAVTFSDPAPVSSGPRRLGDFITLFIPSDTTYPLADQPLKDCGFFNPEGAPWNVNVIGGGSATTNAAQLDACLKVCYRNHMVCHIPAGANILLNNTVTSIQGLYERTSGSVNNADRYGAICIYGSRAGARPKLTLANNTSGFTSAGTPKRILHLWTRSYFGNPTQQGSEACFNNSIDNLDIDCGVNAGAVGLEFNGAQGCAISYVSIDATNAYVGAKVGLGSGGKHIALNVTGGSRACLWIPSVDGFWDGSRPCPLFIGGTLDSEVGAVCVDYSGSNETIVFVGEKFLHRPGQLMCPMSGGSATARMSVFIDCEFQFDSYNVNNRCIFGNGSVYMQNCYARFADRIFDGTDTAELAGNPSGWMHIREYAHGRRPPAKTVSGVSYQYEQTTWHNGVNNGYTDVINTINGVAPPADLQSRHLPPIYHFEDPLAVNVRGAPYNLKGDGSDEGAGIQAAWNAIAAQGKNPYHPKGLWGTSITLNTPANCKLIGSSYQFSVIVPRNDAGGGFDTAPDAPCIRTFNSATDTTWFSNIGIFGPRGERSYALQWRSGRLSGYFPGHIYRLATRGQSQASVTGSGAAGVTNNRPFIEWTDNAGGRFYAGLEVGQNPFTGILFRTFKFTGTRQPIALYGLNSEHMTNSEAQIEFDDCRDINIYVNKAEGREQTGGPGDVPSIWIRNCDRVNIYGGGGLSCALPFNDAFPAGWSQYVASMVRVEDTPNFKIACWQDRGKHETGDGTGPVATPANTHFLLERQGAVTILTAFLNRPTLYNRGYSGPWVEQAYPLGL